MLIDLDRIIGFQWDAGNERKSFDKHGAGRRETEEVFFNEPLLLLGDLLHSNNEPRFHALGKASSDRLLHITFTLREEQTLIRVISARDMHRKERSIYEDQS